MWANLLSPDGRRAMAFVAILGGCVTMTIFAAVGVYLVRGNAGLSFWLAMAAHAQIAIGMTGLIAMFVRRVVKAGKDGIEISDHATDAIRDGDQVTIAKGGA